METEPKFETTTDIYIAMPANFDAKGNPCPPNTGQLLLALERARALGQREGLEMRAMIDAGMTAQQAAKMFPMNIPTIEPTFNERLEGCPNGI